VNAADVESGEELVYYEIDPLNSVLARDWFTFLDDARGNVEIREGDARLLLESEGSSATDGPRGAGPEALDAYDVLLIDAFSGDGVPVHLLTVEALEAYRRRLKEGGVIVFHISNRYNDLRGVLKANAARAGLTGAWKTGRTDTPLPLDAVARVVVMADDDAKLQPLLAEGWRLFGPGDGVPDHRAWTDDYINILEPIAARFLGDATDSASGSQRFNDRPVVLPGR
jgi:spermidine synthase